MRLARGKIEAAAANDGKTGQRWLHQEVEPEGSPGSGPHTPPAPEGSGMNELERLAEELRALGIAFW